MYNEKFKHVRYKQQFIHNSLLKENRKITGAVHRILVTLCDCQVWQVYSRIPSAPQAAPLPSALPTVAWHCF